MWRNPMNLRRLQRTDLIVRQIEAFIHAVVNATRRLERLAGFGGWPEE